jgi:hypothetical protein
MDGHAACELDPVEVERSRGDGCKKANPSMNRPAAPRRRLGERFGAVATRAVVLWYAIGAIAAAYVWAVIFGDGIAGLKSATELDRGGSFPDANAALIAAGVVFVVAPLAGMWCAERWTDWVGLGQCYAVTAAVGAAVFAAVALVL